MRMRPLWPLTLFVLIALFAAGGRSVAAQESPGARVVNSFYGWFFTHQTNWTANLSGARGYLTPSLFRSLEKMVAIEQQEQAAVLDFNPFLNSQEEAQSYTTGKPSGSASTIAVPVMLRFAHLSQPGMVRAIVVDGPAGWRIDNIVYPGNGDLRRALQEALK